MTVAAILTCRNEADVIEASLRHMLAEGVGFIVAADGRSTDGTRRILSELERTTGRVIWVDDEHDVHLQPQWMDALARRAADLGAEWIVAMDSDEFWYSTDRSKTLAEALAACPSDKAYARSYQHFDWDRRRSHHERLPKVAFRYRPDARLADGNHEASVVGGTYGVVDLREIMYRSYEHFAYKVRERDRTLDPAVRARGGGVHQTSLAALDEEGLRKAWEDRNSEESIRDPIPTRLPDARTYLRTFRSSCPASEQSPEGTSNAP